MSTPEGWTQEQWAAALAERPDLALRLDTGDTDAMAEILALLPGVTVKAGPVERREV